MHMQLKSLSSKSRNHSKELHFETCSWLRSIAKMKLDLAALIMHGSEIFHKDVSHLMKESLKIQKVINKHEKKISNAFKVFGIYSFSELFADHEKLRHQMVFLTYKLENLKLLNMKHNSKYNNCDKNKYSIH